MSTLYGREGGLSRSEQPARAKRRAPLYSAHHPAPSAQGPPRRTPRPARARRPPAEIVVSFNKSVYELSFHRQPSGLIAGPSSPSASSASASCSSSCASAARHSASFLLM